MTTRTLAVELLTEEMPPRSLKPLAAAFAEGIAKALGDAQFLTPASVVTSFATPRRLAVSISSVLGVSPERISREKIMPVSVALDASGRGTPALEKKLAALQLSHVAIDALERDTDGKSETLFYRQRLPGETLEVSLGTALRDTIARLPVAKMMRYQLHVGRSDEATVQFARPARRLLALWGESVLHVDALGLVSGRISQGHRFLSKGPLEIGAAEDYQGTLHEAGRVVASFEDRRTAIREQLLRKAQESVVLMPDALLDEVSALVEWPVVYEGSFDAAFLAVPQECLILTMQRNQRYFALVDAQGAMQNRFLLVSNIETSDPRSIISGNERVLRARLSDAKFFFEQDQKKTLESRLPALERVVYHRVLGSLGARTRRLARIARGIAQEVGLDPAPMERAALLSKADLVTEMVGEFPELQGIMGRYYATSDGEPAAIAQAIEEHYRPRFARDGLPATAIGRCVALADKLETIVGMFGVGNLPTGDRDPYALRRHALGALRILMEGHLALALGPLLEIVYESFEGIAAMTDARPAIREFLTERLRTLLRDSGYSAAEVEAVLSLAPERIDLLPAQLDAVRAFAAMPEAPSLAAANKRIGNILKKAAAGSLAVAPDRLCEPAEKRLAQALAAIEPVAIGQFEAGDYTGMLRSLSALRETVDLFFADVMVLTDDPDLRANRLALLSQLHRLMNRFADLSKLAG